MTYRSVAGIGHAWFPFVSVLEGGGLVGACGHLGRLLPLLQERLRQDNGTVAQKTCESHVQGNAMVRIVCKI